jgi:23S rRNA (guanine745-N1)-methyltransferase
MPKNILFKCPSCHEALVKENRTYRCTNNHTYDEAKEGYVNLLLAQHKKSKNPGDNDEMIRSRQAFLNKGYYQSLSSTIVQVIASTPKRFSQSVLDIGCGEGYYMNEIKKASEEANETLELCGIDISKMAVKLAGKRKMNALISVSSAYDLPFFDKNFSTIVSVFSPISATEMSRLLDSKESQVIMVGPAQEHLKGLTIHIYDEVLPHKGNYSVLDEDDGFVLKEQIEIKEEITVKKEDILDLLRMTPYYWQTTVEIKEKILALDELKTTIHFYVKVYAKR